MAVVKNLCQGRIFRVSYRRATWVVCAGNLVVSLCLMYLILAPAPLYLRAASLPDRGGRHIEQIHSKEDLERRKASYKLRRALMPFHLIEEVKELQAETEEEIKRTKMLSAARYKRSVEVSQRLAQVKQSNTQSNQHGLLLKWKKKKLQGAQRYQNEGRHQSGLSKWKRLIT